jgi:DnaJ-class molecular chaperone
MAEYYKTLGVSKNASEKEIRQAFRRLARKYHPDLSPGDGEAEEMFKRINEAYEVLSNPSTRKKYDRYGDKWKYADQIEAQYRTGPGAPFGWADGGRGRGPRPQSDPLAGFEDLLGGFGDLFGRRGRTAAATRAEASVEVSLEEAFAGTKRKVTISSRGNDRRIEVSIPPGVDTGSVVRITPGGGQELLLNITVAPHRRYTRKGDDLTTEVEVALEDTILGGEVDVQTLKGRVRVKIPPESQNGQRIRLAGQGMPKLGSKGVRGDLYIVVRPKMPKNLTSDERELIRVFKALRSGQEEVTGHVDE